MAEDARGGTQTHRVLSNTNSKGILVNKKTQYNLTF